MASASLVLVVGDRLVLDHQEDENKLQRVGVGSGHESCPAPPRPSASYQHCSPPSPVSQTRKKHFREAGVTSMSV